MKETEQQVHYGEGAYFEKLENGWGKPLCKVCYERSKIRSHLVKPPKSPYYMCTTCKSFASYKVHQPNELKK